MKKLFTFILSLGVMLCANAQNPFAYGLSSGTVDADAKTLEVTYSLNAAATSVNALIKDAEGAVVKTIALTGVTKGTHTATLDLTGAGTGDFTWAIQVTGGATSGSATSFFSKQFYHPRGVDVDNSPESPYFGYVFSTEGLVNSATKYWSTAGGGNGLYIFTPQGEGVKNPNTGKYAFMGGLTIDQTAGSTNGADLARVRVAEDGRIFVTRLNDAGSYICVANSAEDLIKNDKFTSLLGSGSVNATDYGFYNASGAFVAGPNLGFDIKGSGANLKMVAVAAMQPLWAGASRGSYTHEYALGNATTLPTPSEVPVMHGHLSAIYSGVNVTYDNRGGIWYCQYRGAPVNATPDLVYVDANGIEKYRKYDTVRGGGGIRLSPDGTQIAISSSKTQFTIYDLTFGSDGVPTLSKSLTITHGIGTNVNDIAWDLAGNIYICGNSSEWLKGFAIPRTNNTFATPAASKYAFTIEENEPETPLTRGEYAYNLDMSIYEHENYTFSFDVTGDAPDANIILSDVEGKMADIVYPIGAVTQGHNEITINTKDEVAKGTYHWAVQINSNPIARAGRYFTTDRTIKSNTRGGVAFVKDTESDAFGKIVVSNGYTQGIDVYSPEQELESTTAYTGTSSNAASTYRIAEHEGIVYITDWCDAYSGVYTFNPAQPETVQQWFNGTRGDGGIFTNANGDVIGGGAPGVDFVGTGAESKMYLFCEDYPTSSAQTLVRYDFGGAETWAQVPDATYPNASAKLNSNTNVEVHATENGIFCTQVRTYIAENGSTSVNDNKSAPALIYVDHNDNILFNSGDATSTLTQGFFGSAAGSFAFNDDMTMMAFATQHRGIVVYSIAWADNVPSFTEQYVIPESVSPATSKECSQLDFDIAGNLHAFLRTTGYCMFVLPNENPTATTAAKKSMLVAGGTLTDVEDIATDANAPVEYYNLQGVKVENPSNGVFIKKQGSKTTKVVL